jgi:TetR/AcrR family transcriptional regulator, tetracycline repressor protein
MRMAGEPSRSRGRPPRIQLDDVVGAAARLIEAEGTAALTMRGVAEACGVTTMALYRHVRTRDELVELVATQAMDDFVLPDAIDSEWRAEVATVANGMHRFLLEHPEFASIFASRPIDSLVAYRAVERILGALYRAGLDDEAALASYDLVISFIRGFVQQHAGPRAEANSLARVSVIAHLDAEEFEHVIRLGGRLIFRDHGRDFERDLEILLDGIARSVEQAGPRNGRPA